MAGVAPEAGHVDLGGPVVATWSYGGQIPGQIRVRKGQVVQALLANRLPAATTVHWHGVAIRNDMDGVPGMTQAPVPAARVHLPVRGRGAGTYWYHPHVGVQLDRGLYGPLIVEDPDEPGGYDHEWTVVLDDWIDGTGYTPDQVLAALHQGMSGMAMAAASPSPMAMAHERHAHARSRARLPATAPPSSGPTGPSPVMSGPPAAACSAATPATSGTRTTSSTAASGPRRGRPPPARASGPGSGSSTRPPTPRSASRWAATG